MKLPAYKIQQFVSSINDSTPSVLIYGPDVGGVSNLATEISKKIVTDLNDPFLVIQLNQDKISDDPSVIADELASISFGVGRKLVIIKNAEGKDIGEAIIEALENSSADALKNSFLLVTAGDLAATSALRKYYEAGKNIAALPCYIEDEKGLVPKIVALLRQKKLNPEPRVVEYIAAACKGDSKIIESEIEKLSLYMGDETQVSLETILKTTGNFAEVELQDICNDLFSNNKARLEVKIRKALDAGLAPIAIIRTTQRYLEKLHNCCDSIKNGGKTIDSAINDIRPPIFFKQVPKFREHLDKLLRLDETQIFRIYSILYNSEADLKESNANPDLITSRCFFDITSSTVN